MRKSAHFLNFQACVFEANKIDGTFWKLQLPQYELQKFVLEPANFCKKKTLQISFLQLANFTPFRLIYDNLGNLENVSKFPKSARIQIPQNLKKY